MTSLSLDCLWNLKLTPHVTLGIDFQGLVFCGRPTTMDSGWVLLAVFFDFLVPTRIQLEKSCSIKEN